MAVTLLAAIAATLPLASSLATEIWLGGVDPFVRQIMQPGAPSDYMALFEPGAPWTRAAGSVNVFMTSSQFVARASDQQLQRMFAALRSRHVALGLGALMQTGHDGCGRGVEGYEGPEYMDRLASRIKRLGGSLTYVAMDEPLWFGHDYNGPNACHSSIAEIVRDVASKVAAIRRSFPAAQTGDSEPVASPSQPADWMDQINAWADAFRAATGENLAFLQADISWHQPWQQQLATLGQMLHAKGIRFGIFYNGDPDDPNGIAWIKHAEERFIAVDADPTLVPDQAVLYSWMAHPLHMLPETRPGTMTWLVNRYAAAKTQIILKRKGNRLDGQLTGRDGLPLSAQRLLVEAVDTRNGGPPAVHTLSGTVPAGAAHALFALRINAECKCAGPVNVTVGELRYKDEQTSQEAVRGFTIPGTVAGPEGLHITAPFGRSYVPNTMPWGVTPGDKWEIRVPMGATEDSAHSGFVALVFARSDGHELQRVLLPFAPASRLVGNVSTDVGGHFAFYPNSTIQRLQPGFRVEFEGNSGYRLSVATWP